MKRLQIFFSDKCPDCYSVVPELKKCYPDAEFYNITESMANLKRFLYYRDHHPDFEEAILDGYVGIPCAVLNGGQQTILEWGTEEWKKLAEWMRD